MSRVLVIDDDVETLFGYRHTLRVAGHDVSTVALGDDGVATARREFFDVVLCDQRLPDRLGVEVIRQIRETCPRTSIVLVTAWGTPELYAEAKRNGATSCAEKPLIGDDLVTIVEDAPRLHASTSHARPDDGPGYAVRRWVELICRACFAPEDVRTIGAWCRYAGLARSTLKAWCKACDVTARASLTLIRLLRLVISHCGEPWNIQHRLEVNDLRTARSIVARAGFSPDLPIPDLNVFLAEQRIIASPALVAAIRKDLLRRQNRQS